MGLLTIEDLSRRWGVSERVARATVTRCGVPRIDLHPPGKHLVWSSIRFREEAVAGWEIDRERATTAAASPAPSVAVRKSPPPARSSIPNHLGFRFSDA